MTTKPDDETPIWGVKNFATVLGRSERQTYHLLESGALDGAVIKIGAQHVSTRKRLLEKLFGKGTDNA